MPRKARVNVMEKSFDHSSGLSSADDLNLSKSEVLDKLTTLVTTGDQRVSVNDVMRYETDGSLRPEVESLLKG